MPPSIKRAVSWAGDNIGFICIGLVLAFCLVHAFDPPRLNWGDSGSDFNTMGAGRNFQKYGFLRLRLTPFLLDPAVMTIEHDKMFIYTHYPQLPDLMNGVLRVVFRMSDIVQFRFVALTFSFASLFFIYNLIHHYWSRRTAQIGIALWVMNPLWIQHADYLHHIPYGAFFGFGSLYFLLRYLSNERWWGSLAVAGFFLFMTVMASYDWWFFGPILIGAATAAHYGRTYWKTLRVLAILGACAVAALMFKLGTNIWALDGVAGWLRDFRFQFAERASDRVTHTNYQAGAWPTLYGRVERFFTLMLFPITAFWLAYPALLRKYGSRVEALRHRVVNPLVLLVAALPFLVLFVEIWVAQYYPGLLIVPFYAVGSAAIAVILLDSTTRGLQAAGVLFVAALLANSLDENLSFKPAFFDRDAIARLSVQLNAYSPPDKEILVNHVFDAQYRYYFNRKIVNLTLIPPRVADEALVSFANPKTHPRTATDAGTLFVQHKRLLDEMYDKGYYYILGRYRLWEMWGNPRRYRAFIDEFEGERDSTLMAKVAQVGVRLYDSDFYSLWLIPAVPKDTTKR